MGRPTVSIIGAGVAGLASAVELSARGVTLEVLERTLSLGEGACSWKAGGMLAPWCEAATTDGAVARLGALSIDWWQCHFPATVRNGSLVVASARDAADLRRFAQHASHHEWVDSERLAVLEPDLAGRFQRALFFPGEAHLDPRKALMALAAALAARGVPIRFGVEAEPATASGDLVVDCRGLAAREALPDLRGVRGEMLVVRTHDVALSRPVRLLHPRIPLYVVPRGEGLFMVGATMIESEERRAVSVRSAVELLNAAYALHPAFGEAEIVELAADLRPAFPDNLPQVRRAGRVVHANGLFRHGFLLSPWLAGEVADAVLQERRDENLPERRRA
jgi:glycine oxidase